MGLTIVVTRLEERLASDNPKMREPINNLDEVCRTHDIAYGKAKNLKEKHQADSEMLKQISNIPYMKRPWGTTAVQGAIMAKKKLGLGVGNEKRR